MKLYLASATAFFAIFTHLAAASDFLKITHFERTLGDAVSLRFLDSGTGASSYTIQSSPDMNAWSPQLAGVSSQGGGNYLAEIASPADGARFFRVVAVGGNGGTATAGFSMSDIVVEEGGGSAQVVVTFSEPYTGPLRYRWNGSIVPGEGGFGSLSGVVQVNGTTAVITLAIPDNGTLDEIRQLSISIALGADTGYELGGDGEDPTTARITVIDDDAMWAGTLHHKGEAIPLLLELVKNGATWSGKILSDGTGLFPANPTGIPLGSVVFSETSLSAVASGIVVAASDDNALSSDATLSFTLSANSATAGQSVSGEQIVGNASIGIAKPGSPHLNVTLADGAFALVRQVVTPPSTEVDLSN